jgi:putative endonuclease
MLRQQTSADPPARCAMYYVYILLNEAKTGTYTGVSDDVNDRLTEHNAGRVKSSRPYRPYRIIHVEPFETLSEARQKEKFYKSATGRRKLKEIFLEA